MAMTREQAYEIEQTMKKLLNLYNATTDPAQQDAIQKEMDKLDPYLDEAGAIVIRATDKDFAAIADDVKAKTKPIDDAVADITKVSAAISAAAQVINAIVAVVGAVGKASPL